MTDFPQARPEQSRLGKVLFARARSQGAEGIVYEAVHDEHGPVLVKEYFPRGVAVRRANRVEASGDHARDTFDEGLTRFVRLGEKLQTLRHDNVGQLHGVLSQQGTAFWIMEPIKGKPLSEVVGSERLRTDKAVRQMADALSKALQALHDHGAPHRDLTPASIIVTSGLNWRPVIVGFSAAKHRFIGATRQDEIFVSPGYTPPELYGPDEFDVQDPRPDIYAASAVLFHLISGAPPPPAPARLPPASGDLPAVEDVAGLLAGITRGAHPSPAERPDTIQAWREDLGLDPKRSDDEGPIKPLEPPAAPPPPPPIPPIPPPPPPQPPTEPETLRPNRFPLILASILVVAVGVLGAWWILHPRPVLPPPIPEVVQRCMSRASNVVDLENPDQVKFLPQLGPAGEIVETCGQALALALESPLRTKVEAADAVARVARAFEQSGVPDAALLTAQRARLVAADLGNDPLASYMLGVFNLRGWAGAANPQEAGRLFGKASAAGVRQADIRLAELYRDGAGGFPKDLAKARDLFGKAANDGSPVANAEYGRLSWRADGDDSYRTDALNRLDAALAAGVPVAGLYKAQLIGAWEKATIEDRLAALKLLDQAQAAGVVDHSGALRPTIELALANQYFDLARSNASGDIGENWNDALTYYGKCDEEHRPYCVMRIAYIYQIPFENPQEAISYYKMALETVNEYNEKARQELCALQQAEYCPLGAAVVPPP